MSDVWVALINCWSFYCDFECGGAHILAVFDHGPTDDEFDRYLGGDKYNVNTLRVEQIPLNSVMNISKGNETWT